MFLHKPESAIRFARSVCLHENIGEQTREAGVRLAAGGWYGLVLALDPEPLGALP